VLGSSDRRGDLLATVRPTVPDDMNDEQIELIAKYRDSRSVPTEAVTKED
jgi:DnaJ-class molecular chaperone